jgi:tetratricopeptide (TPR) repeat protein
MTRWILAVILVVIKCSIFAEEFKHPHLQDWQEEALSHIADGNAYLLSGKTWQALEQFQKASSYIDKSDASASPIGFFVVFGQVIAYDRLGLHDLCKQAIGALFLTINEYDEEEDSLDENDEQINEKDEDPTMAIQFLQNLARLAPSDEVRELLFSIVDDIADELLPPFKFADQPLLEELQFGFDNGRENFIIDLCKHKSFWKNFKKWCREVRDWLEEIAKLFKAANDVREAYKKWKKEDSQNDLSYDEFRHYYNQHRFNNP